MGRNGKTRIRNFSGQLELQLPFRSSTEERMGLTHGPWLLVKLGSHVVVSCVHTKGPHTRKENRRIRGRNHLGLDARVNVEKLGGPWSCFGIFRVLSLRVLS
jgi:hypothetical protein